MQAESRQRRFCLGDLEVFTSSSPNRGQQPETLGNYRQFFKRLNLAFLHYIVAMHLYGSFRGPQRVSDQLMGLTANQQIEDLVLTRRELRKVRTQQSDPAVALLRLLVTNKRALDRRQ